MRPRLFVDMDGTLGVFTPIDTIETMYEQGFFANVKPHTNVVEAVRSIIVTRPEIEVFSLSCYLTDSGYALKEKKEWLNAKLPELDTAHRIFVPCGYDKAEYLSFTDAGCVRPTDFLLDDFTKNLNQWEQAGGRGIKLLNGINHTRGTWTQDRINFNKNHMSIADDIYKLITQNVRIIDDQPPRQHPRRDARDR